MPGNIPDSDFEEVLNHDIKVKSGIKTDIILICCTLYLINDENKTA